MKVGLQGFERGNFEQFFEEFRMPLVEEFLDLAVFEQLPDVALSRAKVESVLAELVLENPEVPLQRLHLLFHPGDFDGGESLYFLGLVRLHQVLLRSADEEGAGVGEITSRKSGVD